MITSRHSPGLLNYTELTGARRNRRDLVLRLVYFSLQMLDLGMTLLATQLNFMELNPLVRASLGSPYQLVIFKVGIPLLIALFIPGRLLIPAIVLIAGVVGWNVKELLLFWF
jgi:hypothetical protein